MSSGSKQFENNLELKSNYKEIFVCRIIFETFRGKRLLKMKHYLKCLMAVLSLTKLKSLSL